MEVDQGLVEGLLRVAQEVASRVVALGPVPWPTSNQTQARRTNSSRSGRKDRSPGSFRVLRQKLRRAFLRDATPGDPGPTDTAWDPDGEARPKLQSLAESAADLLSHRMANAQVFAGRFDSYGSGRRSLRPPPHKRWADRSRATNMLHAPHDTALRCRAVLRRPPAYKPHRAKTDVGLLLGRGHLR